jgi:hypothetical protein
MILNDPGPLKHALEQGSLSSSDLQPKLMYLGSNPQVGTTGVVTHQALFEIHPEELGLSGSNS